jgi:hypothetical protein
MIYQLEIKIKGNDENTEFVSKTPITMKTQSEQKEEISEAEILTATKAFQSQIERYVRSMVE